MCYLRYDSQSHELLRSGAHRRWLFERFLFAFLLWGRMASGTVTSDTSRSVCGRRKWRLASKAEAKRGRRAPPLKRATLSSGAVRHRLQQPTSGIGSAFFAYHQPIASKISLNMHGRRDPDPLHLGWSEASICEPAVSQHQIAVRRTHVEAIMDNISDMGPERQSFWSTERLGTGIHEVQKIVCAF